MTRAIRISEETARAAIEAIGHSDPEGLSPRMRKALEELGRIHLAPSPKSSQVRKTERKRRDRIKGTRAVYRQVLRRAGLKCECGCGRWFKGIGGAMQMDHFEGRARSESVETCWMLRQDCHAEKSANSPSAEHWLRKFIAHCERHGYREAAENTRAAIEAEALITQAREASR